MAEDKIPLSNVIPVLIATLVCDVAVSDPSTNKVSLIGIFDKILADKFPTNRSLSLYMKITDAEGHYEIEVKYVQIKSMSVIAGIKANFNFEDRLKSSDLHIQLTPLPIPEEGRYEFQVWANSIFLGSAFIDAELRPKA
jgi:hypothetical protein